MTAKRPQYHLARVMSDGSVVRPELVPVTAMPDSVSMGRRGFLGVGLGAAAALALMGGPAARTASGAAAIKAPASDARAHARGVRQLIMLPDGQKVATVGEDRMIKVWSLADGRLIASLAGPPVDKAEVAVSADRTATAAIAGARTVFVWSLSPTPKFVGRAIAPYATAEGREYKPRLRHLAVMANGAAVVVASDEGELLALSVDGKVLGQANLPRDGRIRSLIAGADGRSVIATLQDGIVRRYEVPSMQPAGEFTPPTRDGATVLAALTGGTSLLMQGTNGSGRRQLQVCSIGDGKAVVSVDSDPYDTSFSVADSAPTIACVDASGRLKTIDASSGRELSSVGGESDRPRDLQLSGDGARVGGTLSGGYRVWSARDGAEIGTFELTGRPAGAALSKDGQTLLTAGNDGVVALWTVSPPGFRVHLRDPAVSPVPPPAGNGRAHASGVTAVTGIGKDLLATASQDNTVKLWNAANGSPAGVLTGHTADVVRLAATADGRYLVSSSQDRTVRIWSVADRKAVAVLPGHRSEGSAVAISPDGTLLFTACDDATVRVWSLADGQLRQTLPCGEHAGACESLALSRDGTRLAAGLRQGGSVVWSLPSGRLIARCGRQQGIRHVALTPDGQSLVMEGSNSGPAVWPLADPRPLGDPDSDDRSGRRDGTAGGLAVTADGKVAIAGSSQDVSFIGCSDGALLARFGAHSAPINAVACNADGRLAAVGSADGTTSLWYCPERRCLLTLSATSPAGDAAVRSTSRNNAVLAVAFVPGPAAGGLAIADASGAVAIWDLTSPIKFRSYLVDPAIERAKPPVTTIRGHRSSVLGLQFSRDGRMLYSAGAEGTAKSWDLGARTLSATMAASTTSASAFAIAADASRLAVSTGDSTLKSFALPGGAEAGQSKLPEQSRSLALVPGDAGAIISIQSDGSLAIFRDGAAPPIIVALATKTSDAYRSIERHAMAVAPDGKMAVVSDARSYRLIALPDGALLAERSAGHRSQAPVQISPDGKLLATAGTEGVMLWTMPQFALSATLDGNTDQLRSLAFSANGKHLAASDGRNVRVWSVADGKLLSVLESDRQDGGGRGFTIAFSADGSRLAVAAGSVVELWAAAEGNLLATLAGHAGGITSLAFSPDGGLLASGDDSGTIILWDAAARTRLTFLFDAAATPPDVKGANYTVADAAGKVIYFTQPCGTPLPAGATCVCNCVPGAAGPSYSGGGGGGGYGGGGGGGSFCSCNSVCTCVPVFISDRAAKEAVHPIDAEQVLQHLATLPISTWRYRGEPAEARHLGPMAQDFAAAFGLGTSDQVIHAADASGIALAAIQALLRRIDQQDATIATLTQKVASLEQCSG